jgi:hypothetical protein
MANCRTRTNDARMQNTPHRQLKHGAFILLSRLGNQRWIDLLAESEDRYFAKAVDALVLHQNGRDTVMPRLSG